MKSYNPGDIAVVNNSGDLYCDAGAREFINQPVTIVKVCKSGLYLVSLNSCPNKTFSLAKKNLTV